MKINTINEKIQNINFEGRKTKQNPKPQLQHQTTPIKAVPLAVLIAMSPMTKTYAKTIFKM